MMDDKPTRRFERQFDRIERSVPPQVARVFAGLRTRQATLIRVPLAILLVLGGIFSILPVLGLWMLPLGLLLLAIDLPALRGPLAALIVRFRRWWANRRKRRGR